MSSIEYDKTGTGATYSLLLLAAALAAANSQESMETVTEGVPSVTVSQPFNYNYEVLRSVHGTVTEHDSSMDTEYQEYVTDMENVQKLLMATKQLTDESDQLDPEFSNIIQKNFMDLLD